VRFTLAPVKRVAVAVAVLALAAAACSDDSAGESPERRTSNPPEEIVVDGIGRLGVRTAVIEGDDVIWTAYTGFGSQGSPQSEVECLFDLARQHLPGDDPLASMIVRDVLRLDRTIKKELNQDEELFAIVDACISAESEARKEAGELPADFDFTFAQSSSVVVARVSAVEMGLTPDEAECYATEAFGSLPPPEYEEKARSRELGALEVRTSAITECLTAERLDELALSVEEQILEDNARRAQEEQDLQREINEQLAPTTAP